MSARIRLVLIAVVALLMPSLASAQQEIAAPDTAPRLLAGPTIETSATAFRMVPQSDSLALEMQRRAQGAGKPVALMIVGGAAILVGAVIGDAPGTLFMVGGAVALLYGLYLYLQ